MKTINALVVLATIGVSSLPFGNPAVAQTWDCQATLQSIRTTNDHLGALLNIIEGWEGRQFTFSKQSATAQFDSGMARRRLNGSPESMLIPDSQRAWWNRLPATSENHHGVPVTCGAKLALVGTLADKLDRYDHLYSQNGSTDPVSFMRESLEGSLYMVFASADFERMIMERPAIDATTLQRGGIPLFSLGWPFCCAYQD